MFRDHRKEKELSCQEIIKSNRFYDIIRPYYPESVEEEANLLNAECYHVLNPEYVAFFIYKGDEHISKVYPFYGVKSIPTLYSLSSLKTLESTGITPTIQSELTGKDIIIAIADTGIDYTHPAFINDDNTTKILNIWDQTGDGPPPDRFKYGTEYNEYQINKALQSDTPYRIVPEKDAIGHGTYVAGLAAGKECKENDFIGVAPDASLVIVKLKEAKDFMKTYFFISNEEAPIYQLNDILLAVGYIVKKCIEYDKPFVVLVPLITNMEAHDGTSRLTRYMDTFNGLGNIINVTAAGNEAINGHHFRGNFFAEKTDTIDMQINIEEKELGIVLDVWSFAPDLITVAIRTPRGNYTEYIPRKTDRIAQIFFTNEQSAIYIEYFSSYSLIGVENICVNIAIKNPTPGIWTITVFGQNLVNGVFDSYLLQDELNLPGTRFLKPDPYVTCADPGTGEGILTAGAYNDMLDILYPPSGKGLTRHNKLKPDFVAPGVNVLGPFPNNEYKAMTGTSTSAAITAGTSALLLEWGVIKGNTESMNTLLASEILRNGTIKKSTLTYPNPSWGYGRLNLMKSLANYMRFK